MSDNKTADASASGKIPIKFLLGEKTIDTAVVKPLMFKSFADCISEAQSTTVPPSFDARLRRLRMNRQVQFFVKDSVVPVSMLDLLKLSIPDARKLMALLDKDEGKAGKIVRDGDGIDQAITYELGTPIPMGAGKEPIRELEFYAKTYGDIEDVLIADTTIWQTVRLIETIAKPLGSSLTLLPSWAVNLITMADGVAISRDVLPRFTESPGE